MLRKLIALAMLAAPAMLVAQSTPPTGNAPTKAETPAPAAVIDWNALLTIDGEKLFAETKNVGAGAVIIADGQVVATRGYGFADKASRRAFDPSRIVVRVGSMTKTVTAIAVMQLVEQGKLDLDRDVAAYLDFELNNSFPEKITLRRLLSHTAGFSESYRRIFLPDVSQLESLRDYIVNRNPPVIYRPGSVMNYSNFSYDLAAYIVQRVSGEAYETYVERHIFTPLGMASATVRQPPPAAIAANVSTGYRSPQAPFQGYEIVSPAGAGAMAATVVDYARLVAALANGGAGEGARILSPQSVTTMLTPAPESLPPNSPYGYGLGAWNEVRDGGSVVGHGGDTALFHGAWHLWRPQNVGMIVIQNTTAGALSRRIAEAIEARLGIGMAKRAPRPDAAADRAVAGVYWQSRYASHSVLAVSGPVQSVAVTTVPGGIRIGERGKPMLRVGDGIYQDPEKPTKMAVVLRNPDGSIRGLKADVYLELVRKGWWAGPTPLYVLVGASGLLLLGGALTALVLAVRRRGGIATALALIGSVGVLTATYLFFQVVTSLRNDPMSLTRELDQAIRVYQVIAAVGFAALIGFIAAQTRRSHQLSGKLYTIALAGGGALLLSFYLSYNLFAANLNY